MRIKLIIEYDGTNYCGWQRQENALSVQQVIEDTLFGLTGERVPVIGAGRTDSGVHAMGQVGHFDTATTIPPEKLAFALNANLPDDIRIHSSEQVQDDFHARYGAKGKTYMYRIYNARHSSPLRRRTHAHVIPQLDTDKMARAAQAFVGRHDFAAFAASDKREGSTERTVTACEVRREGDEITVTVTGEGFLYNMVRIMTGTLIGIGSGKLREDCIPGILESKDRKQAGQTAPAKGLTLLRVYY